MFFMRLSNSGAWQAKMSDVTTLGGDAKPEVAPVDGAPEGTTPAGELTELARLEIRVGKILEVKEYRCSHPERCRCVKG